MAPPPSPLSRPAGRRVYHWSRSRAINIVRADGFGLQLETDRTSPSLQILSQGELSLFNREINLEEGELIIINRNRNRSRCCPEEEEEEVAVAGAAKPKQVARSAETSVGNNSHWAFGRQSANSARGRLY